MTKQTLLVYGTLRPGTTATVTVPGYAMYDLGWFPGVRPDPSSSIVCERVEVRDDEHLAKLDRYEGYRESAPETSLYIRTKVGDDYIYIYNSEPEEKQRVKSGDWLIHTEKETGKNAQLV